MKNSPARLQGRTISRSLLLMASVVLLASACSTASNTNSTNTTSPNANSTTNTTSSTTTTSGGTSAASSPTAAYKAFQEANRKKDYEAVKRRFSKTSLAMLTEEAKKENKTLDEFIKGQVDKATTDEEVSNEVITGDTGSIDVKSKDGGSAIKLPMVKEDGEWKIAYDKFMEQLKEEFEKMGREMEKQRSGGGNANEDE